MLEDCPGTRIGNEINAFLPAEAKLKAIGDTIILEPLDWEPSATIRVAYLGKPLRGIVKAIGPGRYPLKYNGPKGKRTKSWLGKNYLPTEVKVGDIVELGGLERGIGVMRGPNFPTFLWGNVEHVICTERDVVGVVVKAAA